MANSINYTGDLTCSLSVKDRKASIAWYTDVLGFKLLFDVPDIGWCEMSTPVDHVTVGFSEVEDPQVVGGATLVFSVDDVAAVRAQLEAKKVRFDGETITIPDMVVLATFFDPDGNKFMLSQPLQ